MAAGRRVEFVDGCLHPAVHRGHGQVGTGAVACVAARFDGRPDPNIGTDPRRHHGHGGRIYGGAHVTAVRAFNHCVERCAGHRHANGVFPWSRGGRAE